MDFDSCFQLGYIVKSHGLKGEVTAFLDSDEPHAYREMESVFVEQQQRLIPFFIKQLKIQGNKAVISFEGITSVEQANALKSAKLWLPLEVLPELEGDQFYFHEIIGYEVIDSVSGSIGKMKSVYDSGAQDLLAIENQEKEILIPIVDSIITKVDKEAEQILVSVPQGLIELYTNEDEN